MTNLKTTKHHTVLCRYGGVIAYRCYDEKNKEYYTVVNEGLYPLDVHRHYNYENQARFMCKRAGTGKVPEHYSPAAKRDINYLITGSDKYK